MFSFRISPGKGFAAAAGLSSALAVSGCGQARSQPARSPADQAAFIERTRCSLDVDEGALALVLSGAALQSVRPLYAFTTSGKAGIGSDLRGAVVTVAAPAGVTDVWLDRALECHGAKAALGHIPRDESDPFWLPESSIDIDVRAAKDGFDILIGGYSTEDATRVFARAEAFAKAKNAAALKARDAAR